LLNLINILQIFKIEQQQVINYSNRLKYGEKKEKFIKLKM